MTPAEIAALAAQGGQMSPADYAVLMGQFVGAVAAMAFILGFAILGGGK